MLMFDFAQRPLFDGNVWVASVTYLDSKSIFEMKYCFIHTNRTVPFTDEQQSGLTLQCFLL